MSSTAKNTRATVVPCLRYRDAPKAIEWLCSVFGFEKQLVVPNDDGTIAHAQLSFGNGMVMLGSVSKPDNEFGRLTQQPDEIGGMETQSPYLIVSDADTVYQRAMGRGCKDRNRDQGRRLRRSRLQLPGPRGSPVECRHLRPMVRPR